MKRSGIVLAAVGLIALACAGLWIGSGRHVTACCSGPVPGENDRAAPEPKWTTSEVQDLMGAIGEEEREGLIPPKDTQAALQAAVEHRRTGPAVDDLADAA